MIQDDSLQNILDYSEGQKEAAHRILFELINLFNEYKDDIRIIGGWVPDLMFPNEGHIGSVDVDVLINHIILKDSGYQSMSKILMKNGYNEHPEKYFSIIKEMKTKLSEKFASVNHAGPIDVSNFLNINNKEEIDMIRRDAYEQINYLIDLI